MFLIDTLQGNMACRVLIIVEKKKKDFKETVKYKDYIFVEKKIRIFFHKKIYTNFFNWRNLTAKKSHLKGEGPSNKAFNGYMQNEDKYGR